MNEFTKETYSEVYEVLKLLGDEYIDRLPSDLFSMLENKRSMEYNPQYVDDIPLIEQNVRKETISIIALLYYNYWCNNNQERQKLKEMFQQNEIKHQKELEEKYNPDDMFKDYRKDDKQENIPQQEINKPQIIEEKESIFKRIINKIKSILKKI